MKFPFYWFVIFTCRKENDGEVRDFSIFPWKEICKIKFFIWYREESILVHCNFLPNKTVFYGKLPMDKLLANLMSYKLYSLKFFQKWSLHKISRTSQKSRNQKNQQNLNKIMGKGCVTSGLLWSILLYWNFRIFRKLKMTSFL